MSSVKTTAEMTTVLLHPDKRWSEKKINNEIQIRQFIISKFSYKNILSLLKQEMFVKHVCLPKLKCHCDLDLETPNSIGVIY